MMELFLQSAVIIIGYATVWFFLSLLFKRNDIADIAWGLGYILLCGYYLFTQEVSGRALILYALVFLWGMRLAIYVYFRNKGKPEDSRYKTWRDEWGKWFFIRSYFQVYLFQGLFLLLIIFPVTIVASSPQPSLNMLNILGIGIWMIGFFFETVGDYQLSQFLQHRSQHKGKVLKTGLWKYSRHPNYFGEVTMWWGVFLVAIGSPNGMWGIISPLVITFLILFVSGIPMLEKKKQGDIEYEAYKKKTSVFFPLPPKI
jgi:steroid 5-alpha reductase family enzyme